MDKNKEFLLKIGNNLRKSRIQKNMSMQCLADYCNIDKSTIYRIEKGTLNPTIVMLNIICETLEIEIQTLTK